MHCTLEANIKSWLRSIEILCAVLTFKWIWHWLKSNVAIQLLEALESYPRKSKILGFWENCGSSSIFWTSARSTDTAWCPFIWKFNLGDGYCWVGHSRRFVHILHLLRAVHQTSAKGGNVPASLKYLQSHFAVGYYQPISSNYWFLWHSWCNVFAHCFNITMYSCHAGCLSTVHLFSLKLLEAVGIQHNCAEKMVDTLDSLHFLCNEP